MVVHCKLFNIATNDYKAKTCLLQSGTCNRIRCKRGHPLFSVSDEHASSVSTLTLFLFIDGNCSGALLHFKFSLIRVQFSYKKR